MAIEVRRAGDRFTTEAEGRTTRHSFSFDRHYDPANVGFALLVAHNDDLVAPGAGYGLHPHVDTEIVTWVLSGGLAHQDTDGNAGTVLPGEVQVLGAGTGVVHAEHAVAAGGPTRFVQMWLRPASSGLPASYSSAGVDAALASGDWVPLASGLPGVDAAAPVRADALLLAARPAAGTVLELPDAPAVHLFVARGTVDLEDAGPLGDGDAARLSGGDAVRLGCGGRRVTATTDAELLAWAMHAT